MKKLLVKSDFIHLHNHTEFSTLDGMPKVEEYIIKCNELGMDAVAVTEHGNLRSLYQLQIKSHRKFDFKGTEYDFPPVKPIFGIEFYVSPNEYVVKGLPESEKAVLKKESSDDKEYRSKVKEMEEKYGIRQRYHVVAFAKDKIGLKNLYILNYLSWRNGFYYRPRVDLNLLKKYNEGVILTTACISGWAPELVGKGEMDKADVWLKDMKHVYKDDLYIEIQPHKMDEQVLINKGMVELAHENKISIIATNDCHYVQKGDYESHEVLLAIQSNQSMQAKDRWRFDANEFYMKSKNEMLTSFLTNHFDISKSDVELSLANTLEIVDKCNVMIDIDRKKGLLPSVEIPDEYKGENEYLKKLCFEGWRWRKIVKKKIPEYAELNKITFDEALIEYKRRLKFELDRIFKLKFSKYFLIIYDLIKWAREQNIVVGPGRGSSAASLVCYLTGITSIDPMYYNLLFDRFLNENRIDFPDVDMDFQDDRRKEIFEYLFEKYREENVCQIGTTSRMKGKAALLDVGRVFEVPWKETLEVNKNIVERSSGDARSSQTVEDSFNEFPVCKEYNKKHPDVLKHVMKLEGKARHVGIHAAGIQIAPYDISHIIPIEYRELDGKRVKVSAWDWLECQGVGLVKLDVLGLRTLSVLNTAKIEIEKRHNISIDYEELSLEDEKVLANFTEGLFTGIFQFDSIGMAKTCELLDFTSFEDVICLNALYRPGSMRSGLATHYINRKIGIEKVDQLHPIYDRITAETQGVLVYQEQLIKCFTELANYDPGTGDELRKKVAKSHGIETLGKEKDHFVDGAGKNGLERKKAEELFENMAFFGSYAFNKAHAAAYGVIAYWGMYLKTYFPTEFFYALMYHETEQKETMRFVIEARKIGILVEMPDINKSDMRFSIEADRKLRAGLMDIKGVGSKAATEITNKQPFSSLWDVYDKVNKRVVNRGVIKALVYSCAFKSIHENTSALMNEISKRNKKDLHNDAPKLPVWEYMLKSNSEKEAIDDYNFGCGTAEMLTEEQEIQMLSEIVPIPPPKHMIYYYRGVDKYLDKNFEFQKIGNIDWESERVRIKGVIVDIKYNSIGDFEKEEPCDIEKERMGWGQRYANINVDDETSQSMPQRFKVDIDVFPTFRNIIDKGLGTPVLISARLFTIQSTLSAFVDVMVDLDKFREILEQNKSLKESYIKMDKFQRYFIRHPMRSLRQKFYKCYSLNDVSDDKIGKYSVVGLVIRVKHHWTKTNKKMAFIDLEDESGVLNVVVWADVLTKCKSSVKIGNIIKCVILKNNDGNFLDSDVKVIRKNFRFITK